MTEVQNMGHAGEPKEEDEQPVEPGDEAMLGAGGDLDQSFGAGPHEEGDEMGGMYAEPEGPNTATLLTAGANVDNPYDEGAGGEGTDYGNGATGGEGETPFATPGAHDDHADAAHGPSSSHLPPIQSSTHPSPIKVPESNGISKNTASPSRLPKVKSAQSDDGYAAARARAKAAREAREKPKDPLSKGWNPHVAKPVDTSLALKKSESSNGAANKIKEQRSSSQVSSPTRAERNKRKAWAEAAAKRQAEAARRLMENEVKNKAEAEARMEARKAAVRARIEQEKEAQARLAAKRAAVMRVPGEDQQGGTQGQEDGRHAMRKRSGSPRPLYVRLAEDYERRQQQEEEETKKKMEMQAAIRQVRVQALMNGEVIIRPLPDQVPKTQHESPPRWQPAGRGPLSPGRDKMLRSPHRSQGNSVAGDTLDHDLDATSPSSRSRAHHKEANGMVLYSMQDGDDSASDGSPLLNAGNRHGKLVTRREREAANGQQRFNNARRLPMVDRACSPFLVDPATQIPTNVPAQDLFWPNNKSGQPERPSPAASAGPRKGALEQEPPPPPTSRFTKAPSKQAQQAEQSTDELPSAQQLEEAGVDVAGEHGTQQGDVDLGESFAEDLGTGGQEPAAEPSGGAEEGGLQDEEVPLETQEGGEAEQEEAAPEEGEPGEETAAADEQGATEEGDHSHAAEDKNVPPAEEK